MKQKTTSQTGLSSRCSDTINSWLKSTLLGALLLGLLASSVSAQTNFFTDGNGTDPTPLDQYPSAPGLGWTAAWVPAPAASIPSAEAFVTNANPLKVGGGNYLTWKTTTSTAASMRRPWDGTGNGVPGIDRTWPYVVEFDYRLDLVVDSTGVARTNTFTSTSDFIAFESGLTGTDKTRGTFWIKAQGATSTSQPGLPVRTWGFLDGGFTGTADESRGMFISATNVNFFTNQTYHFKVVVDPVNRVWEGSVSNLATSQSFNTTAAAGKKLNFLHPFLSGNDFNGSTNLLFISRQSSGTLETNIHSLDNVVMYQVPTNDWEVRFTMISPPGSGSSISGNGLAVVDRPNWKGQPFYPASSNFIFSVAAFGGNTVPSNSISLILNGAKYTATNGLSVSGSDADTNRTVTFTGLQDNKNYTANIIAADQLGRAVTNNVLFDTFVSQYRIVIDPNSTNITGCMTNIVGEVTNIVCSTNIGSTNAVMDTSITNAVTVIEGENYNFDPTAPPGVCNVNQTDVQTDRYIQNWVYPRYAANLTTNQTADTTNSYFARQGVSGIDFFCPTPTAAATYWRNCELGGVGWRMRNGGNPSRPFLDVLGVQDITFEAQLVTGAWLNYTHEWPKTNYLVYIRASSQRTNVIYELDSITNYTDLNVSQPTNKLGLFQVTVFDRKEDLRTYQLTDNTTNATMLPLNGKTTLRLTVNQGNLADSWYNYMVFVPVPNINISNTSLSGTDFSFRFNTEYNVHYTAQYKITLTDATWTTLAPIVGDATGSAAVHDTLGGSNRFYRVVSP